MSKPSRRPGREKIKQLQKEKKGNNNGCAGNSVKRG
jgi:hypothetical protein